MMDVAINNLEILNEGIDLDNITVDGVKLEKKEDYDFILTIDVLEYPILYSFERIIFFIENYLNYYG